MRRALVIFITLILLWAVLTEINHALSPWRVYLWIGGLFQGRAKSVLAKAWGIADGLRGKRVTAESIREGGTWLW